MQEQDAVDARDRRALPHPGAVLTLGLEREAHLEAAERDFLHELFAIHRRIERLPLGLGVLLRFSAEHAQGALAKIGRIPVLERIGLALAHIAPVGDEPHQLVIPKQRIHAATRALCLALQLPQQVERLSRVRPTVEDVAGLHQYRLLAAPAVAVVDDARGTKNRDELVECAMDVTDCHDAFGGLDVAGKIGRLRSALLRRGSDTREGERQKRRKNEAANGTRGTSGRAKCHVKNDIVYGPVIPVNHVMADALASILRRAPLTPEKIAFSWRTALGPPADKVRALHS